MYARESIGGPSVRCSESGEGLGLPNSYFPRTIQNTSRIIKNTSKADSKNLTGQPYSRQTSLYSLCHDQQSNLLVALQRGPQEYPYSYQTHFHDIALGLGKGLFLDGLKQLSCNSSLFLIRVQIKTTIIK